MKLVLSINNGFEKYASVVLHSFFQYHKKEGTEIFILCEQCNDSLLKLKWFEKKYSCAVNFCEIDIASLNNPVVNGHVSIAAYFRLLLARLLPQISKVIYLDCDLLINGSLNELWNTAIKDYAVAGVEDKMVTHKDELGFPENKPYFNSGVLLINLDYWRQKNLTGQFLQFLGTNSERIRYWDQDVLNMVLQDKCLFLPKKWNYIPTADKVTNDVRILHFAGKHKPWDIHYPYPKIKTNFLKYCLRRPFPSTTVIQYFTALLKSLTT